MFIVLKVWSPDYVELAEAALTLVFFILLVILAFAADKYNEIKKKKLAEQNNEMPNREGVTKEEFYRIVGIKEDPNRKSMKQKQPNNESNKNMINNNVETEPLEGSQITSSKKDIEDQNEGVELEERGSKSKVSMRDTKNIETKKVSHIFFRSFN
jgi:hypothetical protein